ncbi:MAG: hypothetical protein NTW21_41030, partial [Verrucomicrobia bacterium]|nr:hypothetical protein [Verrucomicrobiota bacterium]
MNHRTALRLAVLLALAGTPLAPATPLPHDGGTASATLNPNQWTYFEVTVPTGNAGWRLTLNATGPADPDLYVLRGVANPTTSSYTKASTEETTDTLTFTTAEATPDGNPTSYVIGAYLPSDATGSVDFTLTSENHCLTTLAWDPGTADAGSAVFTNTSTTGGEYFFKIATENADFGMWRSVLRVASGEANLYLRQDALPSVGAYHYKSERTGNDGIVRPLSNTSGVGQAWYLLVKATAGAQWSLISGDIFASDLGALAADDSSGSGLTTIPPEGIRYFKTTIPTETLAWRLWLQDAAGTATWNSAFQVRKSLAPHPESSSYHDFTRIGQTLLVPGYLVAGGSEIYYLAVPGTPGDSFRLDSRQQSVTDLAFSATTATTALDGFLYQTYRVPVPVQQKAWQVSATPVSGNPNFALRRGLVPNEFNNDAYSEISGPVTDSATLVPPTLSDGTYYITVYSVAAATYQLSNKEPSSYIIGFEGSTPNPEPTRNGWVYFQLLDIDAQLGKIGWLLTLANQVPGTEIAIRRNAMPGRWNYRSNGSGASSGHSDLSTTSGNLQDPGHAADIWYVGIYTPQAALGNFILSTGEIGPVPFEVIDFESISTFTNLAPSTWRYYRVEVPATVGGKPVLGWELKVSNWVGARPTMVVRRGSLPNSAATSNGGHDWSRENGDVQTSTTWNAGNQWATSSLDWTSAGWERTDFNS